MKRNGLTRIASLFLAAVMFIGGSLVSVGASAQNITAQSIEDYKTKMGTISYEEYRAKYSEYFAGKTGAVDGSVTFDAYKDWTFVGSRGNVITCEGGTWSMEYKGVTYSSVEEAVATGLFEEDELAFVKEYDGKQSLYTPSIGTVTWQLNFSDAEEKLYSIALDYYPVADDKSASIEREFFINGEAPFSEARALSFSKIWSSCKQGTNEALTATYTLGKNDDKDAILQEGSDAGFVLNDTMVAGEQVISFVRPEVITSACANFIEKYGLRFFVTDTGNNELRPATVQVPEWTTVNLKDGNGYYSGAFGFVIQPVGASNTVTLKLDGVNEPMAISTITFGPYETNVSYEEYYNAVVKAVGDAQGTDTVRLEAENTYRTSTNSVYPVEDRTSPITSPSDTSRTLLNTIGTEKWETAGQWVEYKFKVNSSGFYDICSRFKQSYLDGMYVCRSLELFTEYEDANAYKSKYGNTAGYYDGVPFEEAAALRYDYGTEWQATKLTAGYKDADDNQIDYQLYFEKDVEYTIRLEVTLGSMSEMISEVEDVLNALNADYLAIIKLTGTSPDDYRDYSFSRLLPDTLIDMIKQAKKLCKVEKEDGADAEDGISQFLKKNAGVASTYSGICDKLSNLLRKMAKDEQNLAKNLDNFKSYVGSLGTFLTDAKTQPLQLDYLMIQPSTAAMPKGKAGFFQTVWHEISSFFQSFVRDYNSLGAMDDSETATHISVWVPYGRDQANVIRSLSTNGFTQDTGIAVDLKLITGGTLLPSILAGIGPDVYLGLDQSSVINYAIRGALGGIEDMPGFEEATKNFNDAAMTVLGIADADGDMHYYGLPEQQQFDMMFVRKDILANLDIEIPTTWEDIYIAQSKLESNNMKIGVTTNYKMHLYQMGGDLFADDGMRINLDSAVGLKAFETMCNLFTQYSFPYSFNAANRFRTGEMPIIISDYTSLYNTLKVFATEIEGCWTFVPLPGYKVTDAEGNVLKDEDGNDVIDNSALSTVTAVVLIADSGEEQRNAAWKYMQWYTSAKCQSDYANEMVAIIGESAKHSTANREALKEMPWTAAEYEEVSKQFENLASIPNYPGAYYIDRYTNFAFLAAYNDDADPSTELLSYINIINNEITRKRQEFKLETLEIGQTLASKRMDQAAEAIEVLEGLDSGKYASQIAMAKYGIANEDITKLTEASEMFTAVLTAEWDGQYKDIVKVNGKTATVESYYINVSKQTAEAKNGGYSIDSLKSDRQELLYFIATALSDAAKALATY